eukprot:3135850-Ditylum_brightwellii.AAC.1
MIAIWLLPCKQCLWAYDQVYRSSASVMKARFCSIKMFGLETAEKCSEWVIQNLARAVVIV